MGHGRLRPPRLLLDREVRLAITHLSLLTEWTHRRGRELRGSDHIGLAARLGLQSTAELWTTRTDLVHFTSALRYPVFEGFSGSGLLDCFVAVYQSGAIR